MVDQPFGVGIEQQFVGIEAMSMLRIVRTMHAIPVDLAGHHLGQIAVPDVVGALGQCNAFQLAPPAPVEQAQLHFLRVGREQREIGATPIPSRAQPMRRAFENPHYSSGTSMRPASGGKVSVSSPPVPVSRATPPPTLPTFVPP